MEIFKLPMWRISEDETGNRRAKSTTDRYKKKSARDTFRRTARHSGRKSASSAGTPSVRSCAVVQDQVSECDTDADFINDESESPDSDTSDDEPSEWVQRVDCETTVESAMKALWIEDPECFYLAGHTIKPMVEYKISHGWVR
tara:strand:- start:108 stop:536 length:429 start_codon:yes stop_codon:yes gene_type:complete